MLQNRCDLFTSGRVWEQFTIGTLTAAKPSANRSGERLHVESQEKKDNLGTAGVVELPVSIIRIAGEDRDRFLHNFCTADIKKLPEQQCAEAFFLNSKGKTLSHGLVARRQVDMLVVSTAASAAELVEHLDRFLLSDDVQIEDLTELWRCAFAFGTEIGSTLKTGGVPVGQDSQVVLDGFRVVFPAEFGGAGFCVLEPASGDVNSIEAIAKAGARIYSMEEFDAHRISCATPWVGSEITEANLAQEFNRDSRAISFTKGCYLGQETVARLDAMGHVNQRLAKFRSFEDEVPQPGSVLKKDGKKVATVTSVATVDGKAIGLGFVRAAVEADESGVVEFDGGKFVFEWA